MKTVDPSRSNGSIMTSVELKQSSEIVDSYAKEEIVEMAGEPKAATVGVSFGMTLNLGNYQSAKVDVHVTLPSDPDAAALEKTYGEAAEFCKAHVRAEVESIKKSKK